MWEDGAIISSDAVSLCLCRSRLQPPVGASMAFASEEDMDGESGDRKAFPVPHTTAPTAPDREGQTCMGNDVRGDNPSRAWDTLAACFLLAPAPLNLQSDIAALLNLPRSAKISLSTCAPWQTPSGSRSRRAAMSMRWIWARPRSPCPPPLAREIPSIDRRSVAGFPSLAVHAGARSLE